MTQREFEVILVSGFPHTPETRADFYLSEAKRNNIKLHNFTTGLFDAFKRLNEYVNKNEYPPVWIEYDNGEKEYTKQHIPIDRYIQGYVGYIDSENIKQLLPALLELNKKSLTKIKKKQIKILEKQLSNTDTKPTITGFKTKLKETQQTKLYKALQNNYIDCTEAEFKAMFTDNPKPIKWIDTSITRHEPNKQTIFEFVYLLNEYEYLKDNKTDLDTMPTNQNNLYRKLEYLFPNINNFASSSGSGKSAKNTTRKKELETIIISL